MKILIIAAHPDDEILGMGGTILKHTKKGDQIRTIYLATGITSRRGSGYENLTKYNVNNKEKDDMSKQIKDLRQNTKKANALLKVKSFDFYDFPDNEMDSISLLKIVKTIENEIKEFQPEKIYTTHRNDLNVDHRITFQATITACRPGISKVKEILSFEVPSSTEWNYPANFNPNYFVNISKELDKKLKAMTCYENESRKFPHPRSTKNLEAIAQRWGSVSGIIAAEAFEIIRKIDS
jgi:LmbE family N-acetylglucosaminyl deacetylase